MHRPRSAPVVPAAVALAVAAACFGGCDGRPGPVLRTSDVAPAPRAVAVTCLVPAPGDDPNAPRVWKVRRGDTLRSIAKRAYGDERFWTEVAAANPRAVDRSGRVREGAELTLPASVR